MYFHAKRLKYPFAQNFDIMNIYGFSIFGCSEAKDGLEPNDLNDIWNKEEITWVDMEKKSNSCYIKHESIQRLDQLYKNLKNWIMQ